ncbi:hypothetical protein EDB86DRAFT_2805031, partial [Lactarius hatsudake]
FLFYLKISCTAKIWSIPRNYEFELEKGLQGHQRSGCAWDCASNANLAYSCER